MNKRYFDCHVFYGRNDGFSFGIIIEGVSDETGLSEEQVIAAAVAQGKIDDEDAKYVDTIDEVDETEYHAIYNN